MLIVSLPPPERLDTEGEERRSTAEAGVDSRPGPALVPDALPGRVSDNAQVIPPYFVSRHESRAVNAAIDKRSIIPMS